MNKKDIRYIQAILNGMDNNAHAESDEIKEFTKRVLNAFSIQSDTQKAFAHTSGQGTTNTTQSDAVEFLKRKLIISEKKVAIMEEQTLRYGTDEEVKQPDAVDNTCNLIRDKNEWPECILTDCCGIGPITYENYCSNCGKKIIK